MITYFCIKREANLCTMRPLYYYYYNRDVSAEGGIHIARPLIASTMRLGTIIIVYTLGLINEKSLGITFISKHSLRRSYKQI